MMSPPPPLRWRRLVVPLCLFIAGVLVFWQFITPPLVASQLRKSAVNRALSSYLADLIKVRTSTTNMTKRFPSAPDPIRVPASVTENVTDSSSLPSSTTTTNSTLTSVLNVTDSSVVSSSIAATENLTVPTSGSTSYIAAENATDVEDTDEGAKGEEELEGEAESEKEVEPEAVSKATLDDEKDTVTITHPNDGAWRAPPNMSMLEPLHRGSAHAAEVASHPWTQPRILTTYSRTTSRNATELFVYATGVTMGNFNKRNLTIYGCVVGPDVYPVKFHVMDVFVCELPSSRRFARDKPETVSLAIRRDAALSRALAAPVTLRRGVDVNLTLGVDVLDLADDSYVHGPVAGGMLVQVPSNVTARNTSVMEGGWRVGSELRLPRYEICGVTMMKQFPNLLDDWIAYHRRVGVDMLYLLDNDATEDLAAKYNSATRDAHPFAHFVDVVYWPFQRSQVQSMSLFAVASRPRCEWLIAFDADEYIMLGIGDSHQDAGARILKRFLARMRHVGYDDVRFKYITMGPSANVYIPRQPTPEAYIAKWSSQKLNVKSASQTARDWLVSKIHYQKGHKFFARTRHTTRVNDTPITLEDGPALVHYQFRSLEEAILKKKFGSSSIGDKNLDDGSSKETRNLKNPGSGYTKIPDHLRYTFFRDIWSSITSATNITTQTLVRWRGKERCSVEYNPFDGSFSDELCVEEEDEGKHIPASKLTPSPSPQSKSSTKT